MKVLRRPRTGALTLLGILFVLAYFGSAHADSIDAQRVKEIIATRSDAMRDCLTAVLPHAAADYSRLEEQLEEQLNEHLVDDQVDDLVGVSPRMTSRWLRLPIRFSIQTQNAQACVTSIDQLSAAWQTDPRLFALLLCATSTYYGLHLPVPPGSRLNYPLVAEFSAAPRDRELPFKIIWRWLRFRPRYANAYACKRP